MSGADDTGKNSEDERGGYLGFVAHEVRNPLSTALWSAELLVRMAAEERGGARGDKLTGMCLRSLSRVRQLIEDHFLCERLDIGGLPLRAEAIGVQSVVDEVVGKRPAGAGDVTVDVDPSLGVMADRALLERAIDSLVAAAGRDGAAVRIGARVDGEVAGLQISGAPPGSEPLADPKKGSVGDAKGRALAIPVARRVAMALGGALHVEGETFVLSLPRAPAYTARPDPSAYP
jgi:K+-sensing histidine kinase KdpD